MCCCFYFYFYFVWRTVKRCLDEVKKHDEETRRERIEYAEKLLQRLKAGPKQLESAFKLSTILAEQEKQRDERYKQKQMEWQQAMAEGQQIIEQAVAWIENQKDHIRNYRKRCAEYKTMLLNDIKEKQKQKSTENQQLSKLEEAELKTNTKQTQEVLGKEQKNATDRRADRQTADYLSKHNIEQRKRSKFNDCFRWKLKIKRNYAYFLPAGDFIKVCNEQNRINRYLEQKRHEEFSQKYQEKLKKKRQSEFREKLAKQLFQSLPDITKVEDKCYQRAVKDLAAKWDEQENKRNDHIRKLKNERLVHHSNEFKEIDKMKQRMQHENEIEKAKRQANEKIDLVFFQQQHAKRVQKAKELRRIISQQMEVSKKNRQDELITSRIETNQAIEAEAQNDDKHFFNYANKLLIAAQHKGIPIHPLKKVISDYTVHNSLLPQTGDLPHMKSQIDIGISLERKYSFNNGRENINKFNNI